jgi:hypothetical protein
MRQLPIAHFLNDLTGTLAFVTQPAGLSPEHEREPE